MKLHKLAIVGISADQEIRHRFEDKFVAHLRGREYEAVTSYSKVADLAVVEDREFLLNTILEQHIDGAISVRVVRLESKDEEGWSAKWRRDLDSGRTLRSMIDESLPHTGEKARHIGVEVALWETQGWSCIWSARTNASTLKTLRKGSSDFVQLVMDALEREKLL